MGTKTDFSVELENVSKKYINEWIFRNLTYRFEATDSYAIVGPNGSGKSTLLQVISGSLPCTSGEVRYYNETAMVSLEEIYKYVSIVSPALETIEEFTLAETFDFHAKFNAIVYKDAREFAAAILMEKNLHKLVRNFSSGMKQRLKLGLSFFSEGRLLLLDEPTTNLDTAGIAWYQSVAEQQIGKKLLIISSNQKHEYEFCNQSLNVVDFK